MVFPQFSIFLSYCGNNKDVAASVIRSVLFTFHIISYLKFFVQKNLSKHFSLSHFTLLSFQGL